MKVCSENSPKGLKNAVGGDRYNPISPPVLPTKMITLNSKVIS